MEPTKKYLNLLKALPIDVVEGKVKSWLLERMVHCGSCDQTELIRMDYDRENKPFPVYKCGPCVHCRKPITVKADNEYFSCPINKFEAEAW